MPQFGILKISFIKCLSSDPYKFQKNDQLCTRENYVLLLLFFEGKKDLEHPVCTYTLHRYVKKQH